MDLTTRMQEQKYLQLLAQQYPTIQSASTALIRQSARLSLPKGTEHFVSDIHGEYEALRHVLRNGSGAIRRRIDAIFGGELSEDEKCSLATLIYYPQEKLAQMLPGIENEAEWYRSTLLQILDVCRSLSARYPHTYVKKFLPEPFALILDDLLQEQETLEDRADFFRSTLDTIISTSSAPAFIIALAELTHKLAISRLHVIGDIFDRGPGPHLILDMLMEHPLVDIQWGNHDIVWMGAAAGSDACIANVVRGCLRYASTDTLEHGYAINLLPLASFAVDTYADDPCSLFRPHLSGGEDFSPAELRLMAQMHKAITIIQFKLEGQLIARRPSYGMEDRLLLGSVNYQDGTVELDGTLHPMLDTHFPTVDPLQPYELTPREAGVVEKLRLSFTNSQKLQEHVRFLYSRGSIYLVHNGDLLFHGCIPMNPDGTFRPFEVDGRTASPREFLDWVDRLVRQGYFATDHPEQKLEGMDAMWYLWSGAQSPLFGKQKMATFERYFIADKATHAEKREPYYELREREEIAHKILLEFNLDPERGHIINGHVPVKAKQGESPVKANGRLIAIDGGFSKAYHGQTGIAGYTLVTNSWGLLLATHHPFVSTQQAIELGLDIESKISVLESYQVRKRVHDTDPGQEIQRQVEELSTLISAYRDGLIKESGPIY